MKYDPNKHHRRSIRLKGYDYTAAGAYFITICTHQRDRLFGQIVDGAMMLNAAGLCVEACWQNLPNHFQDLELDAFVVMPDHMHGILILRDDTGRGEAFASESWGCTEDLGANASPQPSPQRPNGTTSGSIGAIVQNFKSVSTRKINRSNRGTKQKIWQRNYYEKIVRDDAALQQIRKYIINNPLAWWHHRHPTQ